MKSQNNFVASQTQWNGYSKRDYGTKKVQKVQKDSKKYKRIPKKNQLV